VTGARTRLRWGQIFTLAGSFHEKRGNQLQGSGRELGGGPIESRLTNGKDGPFGGVGKGERRGKIWRGISEIPGLY